MSDSVGLVILVNAAHPVGTVAVALSIIIPGTATRVYRLVSMLVIRVLILLYPAVSAPVNSVNP